MNKPEIESIDDKQHEEQIQKLHALVKHYQEKEEIKDRYVSLFLAFAAMHPGVTKWKVT